MRKTLSLIVFILFYNVCFSTDYTAINSGQYSMITTWDVNGVPPFPLMSGDRIIINSGITVEFMSEFIDNRGEFINNGTMDFISTLFVLNSGLFTNNGILNIDANSVLLNSGTVQNTTNGEINNNGIIEFNYGVFENEGMINNNNEFFSCSPVANVTGNSFLPLPQGRACKEQNQLAFYYSDGNCNCITLYNVPVVIPSQNNETFLAAQAQFTPDLCDIGVINGIIELADPILACGNPSLSNSFNGNIAVIDRGACAFQQKVQNAENAGASAVIVCNNTPGQGLTNMAGSPAVNIPAVFISYEDCEILKMNVGSEVFIGAEECGLVVPTLSQWGIIALSMIMMIVGLVGVKKRKIIFG